MAAKPARHHTEVTCPDCGHVQSEPNRAVSTFCRSCGNNFQIRNGKAVPRAKSATRFAPHKEETAEIPAPEPEPEKTISPFRRPDPIPLPPQGFLKRLFSKPIKPRSVVCFDCARQHIAAPTAQSSQCPYCGSYISLRNYIITEPWNRRIQTRGDVIIQKGGCISGIPVVCHDLTVLGELSASVECSGDLIILNHGKIPGKVRCHALRVERGARVEFLHEVEADAVFVDGLLAGQIRCSGTVVLEKRAELRGPIRAARLQVKQGAKHSGPIEITAPNSDNETPEDFGAE
jgi:cytoskeletal protein CcmA (bactofilin family)/Zn finger protein HypA/HybF involved in hydrogenase expression